MPAVPQSLPVLRPRRIPIGPPRQRPLAEVVDLSSRRAYDYYVTGTPTSVPHTTRPGALLMGGGLDVDDGFRWLVNHSGGGNVLVLRESGDGAYNPYIYDLGKVDAVQTIVTRTRDAASDPFVVDQVRHAGAIFLAGGDQARYVELWKGTPLLAAVQDAIRHGVPIGGTSAGLAVLGEYAFAARHDTITSPDALGNPRDPRVDLVHDFLVVPHLSGLTTDTHFVTRDRMGRLVTFLADEAKDGVKKPRGLGVDEHTALVMEGDGTATVVGTSHAYALSVPHGPEVCEPGRPLTQHDVTVQKLSPGDRLDLSTWQAEGAIVYGLSADAGQLRSTQQNGQVY
ncbi:MAG: cyanophycinase [Candidatus Xenobia bacterium]